MKLEKKEKPPMTKLLKVAGKRRLRQIKGLFDHDLKYPRPAPGDFL